MDASSKACTIQIGERGDSLSPADHKPPAAWNGHMVVELDEWPPFSDEEEEVLFERREDGSLYINPDFIKRNYSKHPH